MNPIHILIFSLLWAFPSLFYAQEQNKKNSIQAYSGGMMLHTGYLSAGEVDMPDLQENIKIQGVPWGLGGLLRFNVGKHLRIGGEGYNSTLHYGKNKSYTTLSWGGILIDCQWEINKITLFFGATIGGGSVKNITVINAVSPHAAGENAVYRKYSVAVADPFIGMEYAVAQRVRLITKVDYVFNIAKRQPDFATGVRVYAGVVFFHAREMSKNNPKRQTTTPL